MKQEISNKSAPVQGTALGDWLNALFTKRAVRERFDEPPRRRGMVITLAILVSTLLWFTFTMRETHTTILRMPTEIVNLPEDQALSQLPPQHVRVQVVGDGWSILRLRVNPPSIPLNAEDDEITMRTAIPEFPKNVEIQSVSPSTLNLWKEERVARKLPIRIQAEIETPETHDLLSPATVTPDSVEVAGAASVVGDLEEWSTVNITLEDVRDTLEIRLPLSDTLSGLVSKNVDAVTLRAISEQFTEGSREIDVTIQGQPSSQTLVTLEPSSIRVKYRVLFSQYQEALDAMDFYATVSYDEIRSDTSGRIRPVTHFPDRIELRDVEMIPRTLGYYERID